MEKGSQFPGSKVGRGGAECQSEENAMGGQAGLKGDFLEEEDNELTATGRV